MKITYAGPHAGVDVPAAGRVGVGPGETVSVPKVIADALVRQGWTRGEGDANEDEPDNEPGTDEKEGDPS